MKLAPNQRVQITGFPANDPLERTYGTVTGIAHEYAGTFSYIVQLDTPMESGYNCLTVVSACLQPV